MKQALQATLFDIIDSCRFVQATCEAHSFDEYQADRLLRRAIEREFEIIGVALVRVRNEDEKMFQNISHAYSIIGFRNRLAHGYDSIDDAIVWGIVTGHLPLLLSEIEIILQEIP